VLYLFATVSKAHLPTLATGDGWSDGAAPRTEHLSAEERAVLGARWLASAQMEHASVSAFAQLSLHLAALGAPSELVERSHLAALDEIRHARRCFALASAYGATPWTAGPIAELVHTDASSIDRVRLAVGSLVDGCLAAGIAADVAASGARTAADPAVRQTLAMIALDEERHAELAWSVLAWCLDTGDDAVRTAVAARAARLGDELAHTLGAIASERSAVVRDRAAALVAARAAALATAA